MDIWENGDGVDAVVEGGGENGKNVLEEKPIKSDWEDVVEEVVAVVVVKTLEVEESKDDALEELELAVERLAEELNELEDVDMVSPKAQDM